MKDEQEVIDSSVIVKKDKYSNQLQHVEKERTVSTFQSADQIIKACLTKDIDVGKLEKLLEIKGKFEAEEAKKRFQVEFAMLQQDIPDIPKTKEVKTQTGALAYKYADLPAILKAVKPIMAEHGFSFSWSEGTADKEGHRRVYCHIHGYGHTETNYVDFPPPPTNQLTNEAQTLAMASTYGRRYSFCEAVGIVPDDDTDANVVNGQQDNSHQNHVNKQKQPTELEMSRRKVIACFKKLMGIDLTKDVSGLVNFAVINGIVKKDVRPEQYTVQQNEAIIEMAKKTYGEKQ